MLKITQQAAETIRGIIEESDVGPDGGLRISGSNDGNGETGLEFDVAAGAVDGDETVQSDGAAVFLDPAAAVALADKQLDVHAHGDHFHFSIDEPEAVS